MKKMLCTLLLVAASLTTFAQEGLKLPALSPGAKISQDFSLSSIDVSYSRPSMRNRKIFGYIVPFGKAWRTGANSATKVKFGEDVNIGGEMVKAGEYVLYTIPGADQWEVILNKGMGGFTATGYDQANDVARFYVKSTQMEKTCQTFTIEVSNITFNSCKLDIMWEKTKVSIPVKANNEERVANNIDKAINKPTIPYFQAASYYYETEQQLDKAETYINKAVEQSPDGFFVWMLRARIEKRLGHKAEAIASAKKAMMTAKGSPFEADYIRDGQKIIDDYDREAKDARK